LRNSESFIVENGNFAFHRFFLPILWSFSKGKNLLVG